MSQPPALFDRALRRVRRDRSARIGSPDLETFVADELCERIGAVQRGFSSALVINTGRGVMAARLRALGMTVGETDYGCSYATAANGRLCDEDRLPRDLGPFDLVVAPHGFDTIDDLPGALIAARCALAPGGLFLGCLVGAPSLVSLRRAATAADEDAGIAVARLHPQVDVRAAGDLLARAGYALPVADTVALSLSYPSVDRLIADLRAHDGANAMIDRHPTDRQWYGHLRQAFADLAGTDGRTAETVTLIALTGWAPDR